MATMSFGKKIGILVFIFFIPTAIIVFLNFFGESKFEVPVFYQEGVDHAVTGCLFDEGQHTVPAFSLHTLDGRPVSDSLLASGLNVINYVQASTEAASVQLTAYQMERTLKAFEHLPGREVKIITLNREQGEPRATMESGTGHYLLSHPNAAYLNSLLRCGLVLGDSLPTDEQFVLVDKAKRIRGYYHSTNPEEVDRMIVEMKIILEN